MSDIEFKPVPMVPPELFDFVEDSRRRAEETMGIDPTVFESLTQPSHGARTASGVEKVTAYGTGLSQTLVNQQRYMNRLQNSFLELSRFVLLDCMRVMRERSRLFQERQTLKGFRQSRLLCGVRRPWMTRKYGA